MHDGDRERIRRRVLQGRFTLKKTRPELHAHPYNTRAALVKEKISRG
jgi:hypothetical protein